MSKCHCVFFGVRLENFRSPRVSSNERRSLLYHSVEIRSSQRESWRAREGSAETTSKVATYVSGCCCSKKVSPDHGEVLLRYTERIAPYSPIFIRLGTGHGQIARHYCSPIGLEATPDARWVQRNWFSPRMMTRQRAIGPCFKPNLDIFKADPNTVKSS